VACFDESYINEKYTHSGDFGATSRYARTGLRILAAVPDLRAQVLRMAVDGNRVWTEWDMSGIRQDGALFQMAGVAILELKAPKITSAPFYFEPVKQTSGDVQHGNRPGTGSSAPRDRHTGGVVMTYLMVPGSEFGNPALCVGGCGEEAS
jgi:hypothetical protein